MADTYDVVILGGGAAGYTAGIYAVRSGLHTVVVEQGMPGGQIATTDMVDNYPGIPHISGAELGQRFEEHASSLGVETVYAMVTAVSGSEQGFIIETGPSGPIEGRSLIVATGAVPREVGFEGERAFRGRGVSYCATCDGMFYRDKTVFVVGGGNAACEEAIYLSHIAREVIMVVRRDEFRAPKGIVDELNEVPNIKVRFNTSITEIRGERFIADITFRDNVTNEVVVEHFDEGTVGIFVFAGTLPVTDLVSGYIQLGPDGGIVTDENMATGFPGLFAAGDVRTKRLRQVITAASDGAIAATSAYHYLRQ